MSRLAAAAESDEPTERGPRRCKVGHFLDDPSAFGLDQDDADWLTEQFARKEADLRHERAFSFGEIARIFARATEGHHRLSQSLLYNHHRRHGACFV